MKTSPAGVIAIRQREGCVLHAYRDTRGIPTIGVGHVDASPPVTKMGMTLSQPEADVLLSVDLGPFEAAVNAAVKAPVTQNQFDACVSLAFNIGAHGFVGSTVVHKLNAHDPAGAADAFLMWERPPELKKRRIEERAQFLDQVQPVVPVAPITATFVPPHIVPKSAARTSVKAKAVVVAATVSAGMSVAVATHASSLEIWPFVVIGVIGAVVFAAIHWHK